MATNDLRPTTRPLMTLFAALLAGCTAREMPGESGESGDSGETSSASATTGPTSPTDPTVTTDPTTTSASGTSTDPTSTASGSGTASGSITDTASDPTYEPPECVYADHLIVLTPEEYEAWLNGEGQVGTTGTTGDGTTGASTTGDGTGTTGTGTTDASTTDPGTDTGATTGDEGWTQQLCIEICVALTDTWEFDVESCNKLGVNAEGNIEIKCVEIVEHCDGRMHACIASRGVNDGADPVGAYFARAAHDEAASVYAFAALEQELAALGAPTLLLARVRAAAADEVRHARAVARLATDRGGRCHAPERRAFASRGALEIAVENAVEGCVRETWAALLAAHQAEHAQDPQVRAVMRVIAADEARHAELAWAIDRWLQGILDLAGQAEVASARAAAAASVVAGVAASEPALACIEAAGVPGRASATRLCRGLAAALWAA